MSDLIDGRVLDDLHRIQRGAPGIEIRVFERETSSFDFRKIENVVDDGQQRFAGAANHLDAFAFPLIQILRFEKTCHSNNAVQRRTHFVAHHGQKIALALRRHLSLASGLHRFANLAVELERIALEALARGLGFQQIMQHFVVATETIDEPDRLAQRIRTHVGKMALSHK